MIIIILTLPLCHRAGTIAVVTPSLGTWVGTVTVTGLFLSHIVTPAGTSRPGMPVRPTSVNYVKTVIVTVTNMKESV